MSPGEIKTLNMVGIIILNWNGKEFLEKCVPSVIKAARMYGNNLEIIIADNASNDGSVDYIKYNHYPVKIISFRNNLGFAKAMNLAIGESKADIIIGLNNDVIVDENFISPLVRQFSGDENIFAVGSKMILWDKKTLYFGRAVGKFICGIFTRKFEEPFIPTNTLYACAGAFAVNRKKFLELDGFDEDMAAFWEDLDLCYRAWKQGYRIVYDPRSVVYHKFHGSFRKIYTDAQIERLSGENFFLFILKNFHERRLLCQLLFCLPLLIAAAVLQGKVHFSLGVLRSIGKWPVFLKKRKEERKRAIFSDSEVLRMSNQ